MESIEELVLLSVPPVHSSLIWRNILSLGIIK